MRVEKFCLSFSIAAILVASQVSAGVIISINEIRIDQGGGDDSEYFEIAGSPGTPLDSFSYLVLGDTGGGTDGANGFGNSGIIEAIVSLEGFSIPADGYFLAAESSFENASGQPFEGITPDLVASFSFENSDNVTHLLVFGLDAAAALGDDLDTDDDGVLDSMPWSLLQDGVDLLETALPPANSGEDWAYAASLGFSSVGPDGIFVPGHVFRLPNLTGPFQIGGFTVGTDDTPGSANIPEPSTILMALMACCGAGAVGLRRKLG